MKLIKISIQMKKFKLEYLNFDIFNWRLKFY